MSESTRSRLRAFIAIGLVWLLTCSLAFSENISLKELLKSGKYHLALEALELVPENQRDQEWLDNLDEVQARVNEKIKRLRRTGHANLVIHDVIKIKEDFIKENVSIKKDPPVKSEEKVSDKKHSLQYYIENGFEELGRQELMELNKQLLVELEAGKLKIATKKVQNFLEKLNHKLFYDDRAKDDLVFEHRVSGGETISGISRRYGIYPDRLVRINDIKNSNLISVGQTLRVIPGRVEMYVQRKKFLLYVKLNDLLFKVYPIAIGKKGRTPKVVTKVSDSKARFPVYTNSDGVLIPNESLDNPIGTRWIGLTMGKGYGIHGTRDPSSIGYARSKGCIRMLNKDVEDLFDYVMAGDVVHID